MKKVFKSISALIIFTLLFSCSVDEKSTPIANNETTANRVFQSFVSSSEVTGKFKTKNTIYNLTNSILIKDSLKYDVKAYRLTYNTIDNFGNTTLASGTVLVPQKISPTDVFSVLSYQHGTKFGDADVYNISFSDHLYFFASSGLITIVPDYLGYNASSSKQHPYFINNCSDRNVRDMIVSSLEFTNSLGINHDGKLFLNGFSEGANVTVSLLKHIESNPITGVTPIATVATSGAYDLKNQFQRFMYYYFSPTLDGNSCLSAIFTSYMVCGYEKNIAVSNNYSNYFNYPYYASIPSILNGNSLTLASTSYLTYSMFNSNRYIFTTPFMTSLGNSSNVGFINYLETNSLIKNWAPNSYIKLFHGKNDTLIDPSNTQKLHDIMKLNQTSTENKIFIDADVPVNHEESPFIEKTIVWFNSYRL